MKCVNNCNAHEETKGLLIRLILELMAVNNELFLVPFPGTTWRISLSVFWRTNLRFFGAKNILWQNSRSAPPAIESNRNCRLQKNIYSTRKIHYKATSMLAPAIIKIESSRGVNIFYLKLQLNIIVFMLFISNLVILKTDIPINGRWSLLCGINCIKCMWQLIQSHLHSFF